MSVLQQLRLGRLVIVIAALRFERRAVDNRHALMSAKGRPVVEVAGRRLSYPYGHLGANNFLAAYIGGPDRRCGVERGAGGGGAVEYGDRH